MEFDKEMLRYEMTLSGFEPWARLLTSLSKNQETLFPMRKTFKELGKKFKLRKVKKYYIMLTLTQY